MGAGSTATPPRSASPPTPPSSSATSSSSSCRRSAAAVKKGESAAVVESVKAASDVYSPVSGEVIEANGALVDAPADGERGAGGRRLVHEDQARRPERARRPAGRGRLPAPSWRRSEPHGARISRRRSPGGGARARISPRAATAARTNGASTAASTVPASASPSVVPLPFSREDAVDPEEAFVAALSSCHMLTFIDLARRAGFVVDSYEDEAVGVMERIAPGKMAITRVTLRPRIVFAGAGARTRRSSTSCTIRRTRSASSPIR